MVSASTARACNGLTSAIRFCGALSAAAVVANLTYQQVADWDDGETASGAASVCMDAVAYLDIPYGWWVRTVLVVLQAAGLVGLTMPACVPSPTGRVAGSLVSSTSSSVL